jgi:lysyl-tRNA synthetase class 2
MGDHKKTQQKNISYSSDETQRKLRIQRMDALVEKGVNPFPVESQRDRVLLEVQDNFDALENDTITLAGRIKSKRTSGKIAFATIEDESLPSGFQFIFKKDELPDTKVWTLNFRDGDTFERIRDGIKTIETRALNPEEKDIDRYFGDMSVGDTLRLVDTQTNTVCIATITHVSLYDSLDDAWDKGLDFSKVSSQSYASASEVKAHYSEGISPQYLNKIQTNGLVAITLEIKENTSEPDLSFVDFKKHIDEGDYIQATGVLERSQSGEPSLFVSNYKILTKALRLLPEAMEYDNTEARYLDRVSDFKLNTIDGAGLPIRDMIKLKSKYWQIWREEMINEGFLEVECPVFEHVPGGAEAKPFTTYYNELEQEVYLRISLELPLKKLIAGGFENVFEIGRIFRNEGSSPQHLQEYTQIEWYTAYRDYHWAAQFVKRVYQRIVEEILGTMIQIDYHGHEINWGEWCTRSMADEHGWKLYGGWPAINYFDAVRYFSNNTIDTEGKTEEELLAMCKQQGIEDVFPGIGNATLLDKLWKKARVNTRSPFFLILPPVELEPLAKRDPEQPNLTQRWQVVAGGAELGKAFSELNDPVDQFGRFQEQQAARDAGNEEAQFMDESYVQAMEYGMPPMAGFGTSERFFSFLLGKHIKECVTFPHTRKIEDTRKGARTMVAHAVVLDSIEGWRKVNAFSHLCTALGAREGRSLFDIEESKSKDGERIPMNMTHAIMNKVSSDSDSLWILKREAESQGLQIAMFTKAMQESSDDSKVHQSHLSQNADDIELYGVLIYGKKSKVEQLTDGFELFS